ncbi:hypothetical protein FQN49_004809 [Arthroderma sp. PD_2]|nr:hypothetical protein FQN49_004809 [Arthroderma sp. PD_2]
MNLLVLLPLLGLLQVVTAEVDPRLVGTWTTKSRKVVTGPGFYNPIKDRFIEPSHTGFSFSFSEDGYFEQAEYRAISNRECLILNPFLTGEPEAKTVYQIATNPECPSGMMLFQHGKYNVAANGTLTLDVTGMQYDERQLFSEPCKKEKKSTYYRFNQTLTLKRYEVQLDDFHNVQRLNLYQHDGSPMNRMFLIYKPPQMLPTKQLNPVVRTSSKRKRDVVNAEFETPLNKNAILSRQLPAPTNVDRWWWVGVIMTSIGGIALIYS